MSDDATDRAELESLVGDLATTLESLRAELEPDRRQRRPRMTDVLRFADEVAIPAAVLVLETNVRALELLQRSIRMAEGRESAADSTGSASRRVGAVGETTLRSVEQVLTDVQDAVEGQPTDPDARELLAEARDLQSEVRERLAASDESRTPDREGAAESVAVDVESELDSIRDQVDDEGRRGPD